MKTKKVVKISCLVFLLMVVCHSIGMAQTPSSRTYQFDSSSTPRWSSFENSKAAKGKGGMENHGAKGHPSDALEPGETKVLLDTKGSGIINRIWMTVMDRSPLMLRSMRIDMFWDGSVIPAVSVPLGDFFGVSLGKTARFHNALFSNPEGRSFLSLVQMPFKTAARITITNESSKRQSHIFYDINFEKLDHWNPANLYFHAVWNRDTATTLGKDFELLPQIYGRGRFMGVNVGVIPDLRYKSHWWGEGEVKMYLDGDKEYPTLIGTGAEDYIGTAWGQGIFFNDFTGCLLDNKDSTGWSFYRYHIPDPIYFKTDFRVTIQQMGSDKKELIAELQRTGVPLIPATIDDQKKIHHLYTPGKVVQLDEPSLPGGYAIFYRSDDVSATAYFYLDKPGGGKRSTLALRTAKLSR